MHGQQKFFFKPIVANQPHPSANRRPAAVLPEPSAFRSPTHGEEMTLPHNALVRPARRGVIAV
jgi:hypothetical protein